MPPLLCKASATAIITATYNQPITIRYIYTTVIKSSSQYMAGLRALTADALAFNYKLENA